MDKKKILVTTDTYLPRQNDISNFLTKIIPCLTDKFDITLLTPQFENKPEKINNTQIIRLPLSKIRDIHSKEIEKYVSETDLVFNNTTGQIGQAAIKAAKKLGKPSISYVHKIEWDAASKSAKRMRWLAEKLARNASQQTYNNCTLLLTPTKETEDVLTANGIQTKKITIELGTSPDKYKPPASKIAAKKKLNLPENYTIIGYAGELGREKDITTLANAFIKVNNKNKNTILMLIGEGLPAETPAHIKIAKIGPKQNILPYLQAMDIFVLPSLTETTPINALKAMATGIPVITTPVGCMKYYIQDRENGMIFPRGDENILADKIETLISDPHLTRKLGGKARQTIQSKHRWAETVNKLTKVLERI